MNSFPFFLNKQKQLEFFILKSFSEFSEFSELLEIGFSENDDFLTYLDCFFEVFYNSNTNLIVSTR